MPGTLTNPTYAAGSEIELVERRARVADRRNQGWTLAKIADEVGVSTRTVASDVKWLVQQWEERAIRSRNAHMADMLSSLNTLEREAWAAFFRSVRPVEETKTKRDANGKVVHTETKKRNQSGDPRFMTVIDNILQRKAYLLGLMEKNDASGGADQIPKAKILVVRDRQQLEDLVDVTSLLKLDVVDAAEVRDVSGGDSDYSEPDSGNSTVEEQSHEETTEDNRDRRDD